MENATLALRHRNWPPESAGPSTSRTTPESISSNHVGSAVNGTARIRRKPIPRKGHRKSRGGCSSCKQRKVKCPENTPTCTHCSRLGLACEYPNPAPKTASSTAVVPSAPLQSTGARFTMQDFKFFHHFVLHAYPRLPLRQGTLWQGVASISHHFDYLSHAMLGLGASHLCLLEGANYKPQALAHRVAAIQALNQALSRPCSSEGEADALYATLMVLAFQASFMLDGMRDIFPMLRGCFLVIRLTLPRFSPSLFQKFSPERHEQDVHEITRDYEWEDSHYQFIDAASVSVDSLQPLCQTPLEKTYHGILQNILKVAKVSLFDSMMEIPKAYSAFALPTQTEFDAFMSDSNYVAQILMIHFFILEYAIGYQVLRPIMASYPFRAAIMTAWVHGVDKNVPAAKKCYMDWPMQFLECIVSNESSQASTPE